MKENGDELRDLVVQLRTAVADAVAAAASAEAAAAACLAAVRAAGKQQIYTYPMPGYPSPPNSTYPVQIHLSNDTKENP